MKQIYFPILFIATIALTIVGCDVDQTQKAKMPEVDLDVDVEKAQLPAFDVDWADLDVGTRMETVMVPKVKVVMEEMEVEVPYLDLDMPNEGEKEERVITVEADIANEVHSLEIQEVYGKDNRLYVISELKSTGKSLQDEKMRVSDRLIINVPEKLDVKHYIVGKRQPGVLNRQYNYISNKNAIAKKIKGGKKIYSK